MVILKQWRDRIDAMSLRERVAVFGCALAVLWYLWFVLLMQPLEERKQGFRVQMQQRQAEQVALNAEIQNLVVEQRDDPAKAQREKIAALRRQLEQIETDVRQSAQQLITPDRMALMLQTVLQKVKGLDLLGVKGLGSQPVVKVSENADDEGGPDSTAVVPGSGSVIDNAYKHGLRIEFEGDYLGTLDYIRELENLEWRFFWESLDLNVIEYPRSKVEISVFTLSLDRNWIGV